MLTRRFLAVLKPRQVRKFSSKETRFDEESQYTLPPVEKAKAMLFARISGSFTSIAWTNLERKEPLYGSVMPYILHKRWYCNPIIAIRKDEPHEANLQDVPKSSLHIFPLTPKHIQARSVPLPRINMTGEVQHIDKEEDIQLILNAYDKTHPGSRQLLEDTSVFKFYEFQVGDVHFMGSSGDLLSFPAADFKACPEDHIAPLSRPLIELANTKYPEELKALCKAHSEIDVSEAFIFSLDCRGFDIMGKENETSNWTQFRMPFDNPVTNITDYGNRTDQALKKEHKKADQKQK